jgi:hypothetical protein
MTPKDPLPVYDDTWPDRDVPEKIQALLKKLAEKAS